MIKITLSNGAIKDFANGVEGFEIAKAIAISLAKNALAIKVNNELRDLSYRVECDANIEIITLKSKEALEIIRHDCAHLMAQAVKEIYPQTQVTIGPAIENGFYYDFARSEPFNEDDLQKIENKTIKFLTENLFITEI